MFLLEQYVIWNCRSSWCLRGHGKIMPWFQWNFLMPLSTAQMLDALAGLPPVSDGPRWKSWGFPCWSAVWSIQALVATWSKSATEALNHIHATSSLLRSLSRPMIHTGVEASILLNPYCVHRLLPYNPLLGETSPLAGHTEEFAQHFLDRLLGFAIVGCQLYCRSRGHAWEGVLPNYPGTVWTCWIWERGQGP